MQTNVLLLIDENDTIKNRASLLSAAQKLGQVSAFVTGSSRDIDSLKTLTGIDSIFWLNRAGENFSTETLFSTIEPYIEKADCIVSSADVVGRNLLPKLAGKFQQLIVTNVLDIDQNDDHYLFKRPSFMGNIIETIAIPKQARCFLTVQAARFIPADNENNPAVSVYPVTLKPSRHEIHIEPITQTEQKTSLNDANIVIGCGFGTKNLTNIDDLVHNLNKIGVTAVGVTRALIDYQSGSLDALIGQTGKSISPDIYLALGISGASQHICGVLNAKKIIAVNKDPEAPIFQIADYGLIGDLHSIVPELIKNLFENHDKL